MKNRIDDYKLVKLESMKSTYIDELYDWYVHESEYEKFTCRPVSKLISYEKYCENLMRQLESTSMMYLLIGKETVPSVYGKVTLFDFNPRNRSAEFGYYLPKKYRGQGLGTILISKFLEDIFDNSQLRLNKIYATTSSANIASIELLEKYNFKLDGRQREHYWIGDKIEDQLIYSLLKRELIKENIE